MENKFKQFLAMHDKDEPLLIGNVWNVQSAKIYEKNGYKAIATSSAAIAETLDYGDGEEMSLDEYLFVIEKIAKHTNLPFSVDLEAGYGETLHEIVENIKTLANLGIVGINLEDSLVEKGKRTLVSAESFQSKLTDICANLKSEGIDIFINARCDAFLLELDNPMLEAERRIKLYESTGVHGIFLPCITRQEDIKTVAESTHLPLNVMCMPALPKFDILRESGVKRISSGNFINGAIYSKLQEYLLSVEKQSSFEILFR